MWFFLHTLHYSGFSRKTEIYIYIYSFCSSGHWEVPWLPICWLEYQELPQCHSFQVQSPVNQECGYLSFNKEWEEFAIPLTFCSLRAPRGLDGACLPWWGQSSLLSLSSNADNFFQKPPHRHTETCVLPAIRACLSPVKLTCKINYSSRECFMSPSSKGWM